VNFPYPSKAGQALPFARQPVGKENGIFGLMVNETYDSTLFQSF